MIKLQWNVSVVIVTVVVVFLAFFSSFIVVQNADEHSFFGHSQQAEV